jgi:hypothetical protein
MPLDAYPVEGGNIRVEDPDGKCIAIVEKPVEGLALYVSHFATCPHADEHRHAV